MRKYTNSIGKPDQGCINEDAVLERKNLIAVSDGAGGGGLFAEQWSAYLLSHLPTTPICSADELDAWIGDIWEPYYDQCEKNAKPLGEMYLDKFYDEGSLVRALSCYEVIARNTQRFIYCRVGIKHFLYLVHHLISLF